MIRLFEWHGHCSNLISYLCLVDAPSPATAFSCLSSFPDLLISLSALGDGVATGVEGGVTGDMLPIEILGRSGDSISMCLFLQIRYIKMRILLLSIL